MNKLYINYDNNIHTCTCKQTNGASTVCKMHAYGTKPCFGVPAWFDFITLLALFI